MEAQEGVMEPYCLSRAQDKLPQVRNKRQNLAQVENTPQGRSLTTWRGRSPLLGNVVGAVLPHTKVGWVSSTRGAEVTGKGPSGGLEGDLTMQEMA